MTLPSSMLAMRHYTSSAMSIQNNAFAVQGPAARRPGLAANLSDTLF